MPDAALDLILATAPRSDVRGGRDAARHAGDDALLVRAVRAGEPGAFERLHRRYAPVVHGILLARVPVEDADDLVQDVFVHAMRKLWTLRDAGAVGPWLCTIARNAAARFHRRRRPVASLPAELPEARDSEDPDAEPAREARVVLRVITELPEAYRETLVLRLVEGLSGPEIACATGLTAGSVRVNLHRGMKLLRERLESSSGEEGRE